MPSRCRRGFDREDQRFDGLTAIVDLRVRSIVTVPVLAVDTSSQTAQPVGWAADAAAEVAVRDERFAAAFGRRSNLQRDRRAYRDSPRQLPALFLRSSAHVSTSSVPNDAHRTVRVCAAADGEGARLALERPARFDRHVEQLGRDLRKRGFVTLNRDCVPVAISTIPSHDAHHDAFRGAPTGAST